jgi:hypothetical protein
MNEKTVEAIVCGRELSLEIGSLNRHLQKLFCTVYRQDDTSFIV